LFTAEKKACIKLDPERRIGRIDRKIYGNFIEHLSRCIYGGIYEEGSPLSDERGFRRDVLEAVRGLNVSILRWPGGNFVSGYHWMDGIGSKESRPRRFDRAWQAEESNAFGTDEFIEYCRAIGAEPYICVNLGTGTIEEAANWVEYCNGSGNTYFANLRRVNGHAEPYNVRYWGLGNEMYGSWQIGALDAEDYAKVALEAAKIMRCTDPAIRLISCGKDGMSDWDHSVLMKLAPMVEYHSIHLYTGDTGYYPNVFGPHHAERCIRSMQAIIDEVTWKLNLKKKITIAFDEWNQMPIPPTPPYEHRHIYSLADALAVALYLNIFQRQCNSVTLANLAQLVNVIAPIFTSPEGLFKQTIYHPLALYANRSHEIAIDARVDSPMISVEEQDVHSPYPHRVWEMSPFGALDVSATCDESGSRLALAVINRAETEELLTDIRLTTGKVKAVTSVCEVNGAQVTTCNGFDAPQAVMAVDRGFNFTGRSFEYTFPAHSLTFFNFEMGG